MSSGSKSKIALVTGASSGLGKATSVALAEAGWMVAAVARSEEGLARLTEEAPDARGKVRTYRLDVTKRDDVARVCSDVERDLGPIHLALLNAGTHRPVEPATLSSDDFRDLVEINQMGTVYCLEAVLPGMLARKAGRIAIVASLAGYFGLPTASAYAMTKAGLIAMAESLRPELAQHGVIVQVVNPGFVKTPLTDRNSFTMPFLMDVEPAARRVVEGLESDRFEIVFPRRFALLLRLLQIMPYRLALALTQRLVPKT